MTNGNNKNNVKLMGLITAGIGIGIGLLAGLVYIIYKNQQQPQFYTYPYYNPQSRRTYYGFISGNSNEWEPLSEEDIKQIKNIIDTKVVEIVSEP